MTMMQMYWFLMLDNIKKITMVPATIFVIFTIVFIICMLANCDDWDDLTDHWKKVFIRGSIISFIFAFIFISLTGMIPSTKQMAIIYVVPKIINNKQVQEIPKKMLELSTEWLDELSPENVKDDMKAVAESVNNTIEEIKK